MARLTYGPTTLGTPRVHQISLDLSIVVSRGPSFLVYLHRESRRYPLASMMRTLGQMRAVSKRFEPRITVTPT